MTAPAAAPGTITLAEAARRLGVPYTTLLYRAKLQQFPTLTVEATGRIYVREADLELIASMYAPK